MPFVGVWSATQRHVALAWRACRRPTTEDPKHSSRLTSCLSIYGASNTSPEDILLTSAGHVSPPSLVHWVAYCVSWVMPASGQEVSSKSSDSSPGTVLHVQCHSSLAYGCTAVHMSHCISFCSCPSQSKNKNEQTKETASPPWYVQYVDLQRSNGTPSIG